jgi:hypothetical protein
VSPVRTRTVGAASRPRSSSSQLLEVYRTAVAEYGVPQKMLTDKDTLDKISPRSLELVGQTALRLLALLQQIPSLR